MQNNSNPRSTYFDSQTNVLRFWILIILLSQSAFSAAQIAINFDNFVYTQSFNGLNDTGNNNPWTNNSTLPGWYAACSKDQDSNEVPTNITAYRTANTGTNSGLYSFGTAPAERALGSIATDLRGHFAFGVHFTNTSLVNLNAVTISFRAEHWWKSNTSIVGYQRTKVSYVVGNPIDLTAAALLDDDAYVDVPEAYLVSIDTNPADLALNGNAVFATISLTIPISIPAGSEFFLRFYDENLSGQDIGLAVDDLSITFSSNVVPFITATSDYPVFPYIDMGIVEDIPDPDDSPTYFVPTNDQINDWQQILENFYDDNNLADVDASEYDYVVAEFTDPSIGQSYHVLRKQNYSSFFWGTYVKTVNATSPIVIQSPHAVDDSETGTQGAAVYYYTLARGLMLSGISRCASGEYSTCSGETSSCSSNDTEEPFRKSDVSHEPNSIFHLATTIFAALNPALVFVQLHGFDQDGDDPDFIISCGTLNAELKSVPDYPVIVRENLLNIDPVLDIKITHVDSYTELGAKTNIQGRHLNLYPQDICVSNTDPTTVTNRFLHIEQFLEYREEPQNYQKLAQALTQSITEFVYEPAVPIYSADEFSFYFEEFTNLASSGLENTWGNNLHVLGWYAVATTDDLFSTYHIAHGQLNNGGIYSFGPNASSDRALGSIATANSASAGDIAYGILFTNQTGITIYGVELEYDREQWRDSDQNGVQTVELGYQISDEIDLHPLALLDNNAFVHVPAGDLLSSDLASGIGPLDGNLNSVHIDVTIPIELPDGHEIFIRFFDADNVGFDKALAVDNFYATFSAEPPLPVQWSYFNITEKNGKPFLEWGAEDELNCKNYTILRSFNGKQFENISMIPCQNKILTNHYTFTDHSSLWHPNIYYKILQTDTDGEVTYSPVKSFTTATPDVPRVFYQNGKLIVNSNDESKLQSVMVMNFMGRIACQNNPERDSNSHYSVACQLPPNQLLIVQLVFASTTHVVHLRTGN